ncbi:MAG: peptidylprolyl isomerase [bacterium]
MAEAKTGDTVKVHYTGRLNDGTVFDSSIKREPLQFTLGDGKIIPAFEEGVVGMVPGQTKRIDIPADSAYGQRDNNQVQKVPREQFPADFAPELGKQIQLEGEQGQRVVVSIVGFDDDSITLDANHPLAGQDLSFEIELVEIAA